MISKETLIARINAILLPNGEYLSSRQRWDKEIFTICRLVPTRANVDVKDLARTLGVELGAPSGKNPQR